MDPRRPGLVSGGGQETARPGRAAAKTGVAPASATRVAQKKMMPPTEIEFAFTSVPAAAPKTLSVRS